MTNSAQTPDFAQNVTFSDISTIRIGGEIEHYFPVHGADELLKILPEIIAKYGEFTIIGGGSNILPPDGDYTVPIVHMLPSDDYYLTDCGTTDATDKFIWAGISLDTVASKHPLASPLSGIPGTLGGAIIGNAGAYGSEIGDIVCKILVIDTATFELREMSVNDYRPSYRSSRLKGDRQFIVVGVQILDADNATQNISVRHAQLANALGCKVGDSLPALKVREAVLSIREQKGMVEPSYSCGSYFTNPIIPRSQVASLPDCTPVYEISENIDNQSIDDAVKVSAAYLIEQAGFTKGYKLHPDAPVGLSTKHVLSIVNVRAAVAGAATVSADVAPDAAADLAQNTAYGLSQAVSELECHIVDTVYRKYNIKLTPEPVKIH